jgi:hypothetical protein
LLNKKFFRTCWIDTFENDHFDDPFLLISAEIYKLIKDNSQGANKDFPTQFMNAVKPLAKPLALAGELSLNAIGKHYFGTDELTKKATEALSKQAGEWIEAQIKNYGEKDKSLTAFKKVLKEFCALEKNRPVIIFVDELDRCKPTFALAFLERLKHYFNIPNLVFVLLLNQESLCATVKKTYGQEIDPDEYLQKFIGIQLSLFTPENKSIILEPLADPYLSEENKEAGIFLKDILNSLMEESFPVSLRQLHKIFSHFWLLPHSKIPIQLDTKIRMFLLVIKYLLPLEYKTVKNNPIKFRESQVMTTLNNNCGRKIQKKRQEIHTNMQQYYGSNVPYDDIESALESWREERKKAPEDSVGAVMLINERLSNKEQEIFEMVSKGIEVLNTFIN